MLWVVLAAMTAAALALIVAPLWRSRDATTDRAAYDVEVYRDQLGELDRDLERGLIDGDGADAARAEIGRRLLAADAAVGRGGDRVSGTRGRAWTAVGLALAVPAVAAVIYGSIGAPGLPARPAAERQAAAPAPAPDRSARRDAMIARLGERVRQSPDDAEAWSNLGILLMSARRYAAAAEALGEASRLTPRSAGVIVRYGEALAFADDGVVGEKARELFESALAIDAGEPRARFYLGMAEYQAGRREAALRRWRALEAETPADAPWRATLHARIARLVAELGGAPETPGAQAPGPTADDVAAASLMSGDDRQAMIRSMVARLAARLADTPDDADGWTRLARSYEVLGEAAKSRAAQAKAAAARARAARGAEAPGPTAPGPTADDVAAASLMSGDDRQAMIRSMVARLAARLADTPGDADGWMRLGRSYKVLGEAAKSRAAYAKAAALRPDDVAALSGYAASFAKQAGADATSQPEFNDVIARLLGADPDNATALWFAGLRARQSGDGAAAGRHWRKLLGQLAPASDEHAELSSVLGELEAGR